MAGASGGDAHYPGGKGAIVSGVVRLTKGTVLHILIGQTGLKGIVGAGGSAGGGGGGGGGGGAGGGGGTFVVFSNSTLLAVAGGGGGGGRQITSKEGDNAQTSRNGSVYGGVNGLGGSVCADEINAAGGGGGFNGDGKCSFKITCTYPRSCNEAGLSYLNGGLGGNGNGNGGFGGGGAAYNDFPGGGGGYSGGGVYASSFGAQAGGGGSFDLGGVKPSHALNGADGYVIIRSQ